MLTNDDQNGEESKKNEDCAPSLQENSRGF